MNKWKDFYEVADTGEGFVIEDKEFGEMLPLIMQTKEEAEMVAHYVVTSAEKILYDVADRVFEDKNRERQLREIMGELGPSPPKEQKPGFFTKLFNLDK